MQEQLRALIRKHCLTLKGRVEALGGIVTAMGDRPGSIAEARDLAHQIVGASGSMGFRAVSVAAASLERHLECLLERGREPDARAARHVLLLFDDLKRTADASTPESSTLYDADIASLTRDASRARTRTDPGAVP